MFVIMLMLVLKTGHILIHVYFPATGVPKMPTANSSQVIISKTKTITKNRILVCFLFTFLIIGSIKHPAPYNRIPAIKKSEASHVTSVENCMAMNGIKSITVGRAKIPTNLLFCVVIILILHVIYLFFMSYL